MKFFNETSDTAITIFNRYKAACSAALGAHCSFALYIEPGNHVAHFICDDHSSRQPVSDEVFFAVPWLCPFSDGEILHSRLTPDDAAALSPSNTSPFAHSLKPWSKSTDRQAYLAHIQSITSYLQADGGKTVISTVDCHRAYGLDVVELAAEIFASSSADSHRCIMYTPSFGAWIIASPELLVDIDRKNLTAKTIALAGTMNVGDDCQWDDKNIGEQRMVSDFIAGVLGKFSSEVIASEPHTRKAGRVRHIETCFEARLNHPESVESLLDTLSPTPAVCGTPRKAAVKIIEATEEHPRRLYGGYFGVSDNERFIAAVTLRCAQVSDSMVCIYAGGGITEASVPDDEWTETRLKGAAILDSISKFSNSAQPD